jgi:hypothetical protein
MGRSGYKEKQALIRAKLARLIYDNWGFGAAWPRAALIGVIAFPARGDRRPSGPTKPTVREFTAKRVNPLARPGAAGL